MRTIYKCDYCKEWFDDLYLLNNPEKQICDKCLDNHPRLEKKWKSQFSRFIEGIQDFNEASKSIVFNINKAMRALGWKSLEDNESIKKNLQAIYKLSK